MRLISPFRHSIAGEAHQAKDDEDRRRPVSGEDPDATCDSFVFQPILFVVEKQLLEMVVAAIPHRAELQGSDLPTAAAKRWQR